MQTHNQNNADRPSEWEACPRGEIVSMAASLQARKKAVRLRQMTTAVAAVMILVLFGQIVLFNPAARDPANGHEFAGGIWCRDVQANLIPYVQGQLDEDLESKIKAHLRECEYCASKLPPKTELAQATTPGPDATSRCQTGACDCEHCQISRYAGRQAALPPNS